MAAPVNTGDIQIVEASPRLPVIGGINTGDRWAIEDSPQSPQLGVNSGDIWIHEGIDDPDCLSGDFSICPWPTVFFGHDDYFSQTSFSVNTLDDAIIMAGDTGSDASKLLYDCHERRKPEIRRYSLDGIFIDNLLDPDDVPFYEADNYIPSSGIGPVGANLIHQWCHKTAIPYCYADGITQILNYRDMPTFPIIKWTMEDNIGSTGIRRGRFLITHDEDSIISLAGNGNPLGYPSDGQSAEWYDLTKWSIPVAFSTTLTRDLDRPVTATIVYVDNTSIFEGKTIPYNLTITDGISKSEQVTLREIHDGWIVVDREPSALLRTSFKADSLIYTAADESESLVPIAKATDSLLMNLNMWTPILYSDDRRMFIWRESDIVDYPDNKMLVEFNNDLEVVQKWNIPNGRAHRPGSSTTPGYGLAVAANRILFPAADDRLLYELNDDETATIIHEFDILEDPWFVVAITSIPGLIGIAIVHLAVATSEPTTALINFRGIPDYP